MSLTFLFGKRIKIFTYSDLQQPEIAADPVSPEVAPITVKLIFFFLKYNHKYFLIIAKQSL